MPFIFVPTAEDKKLYLSLYTSPLVAIRHTFSGLSKPIKFRFLQHILSFQLLPNGRRWGPDGEEAARPWERLVDFVEEGLAPGKAPETPGNSCSLTLNVDGGTSELSFLKFSARRLKIPQKSVDDCFTSFGGVYGTTGCSTVEE